MIEPINDPKKLPGWFKIENYAPRLIENPSKATQAVIDRFISCQYIYDLCRSGRRSPAQRTINLALEELAHASENPFQPFLIEPLTRSYSGGSNVPRGEAKLTIRDERTLQEQTRSEAARDIAAAITGEGHKGVGQEVNQTTFWHALQFVQRNEDLLDYINELARHRSCTEGWDFLKLRDEILMHIPMYDADGAPCVFIKAHPTKEAEKQAIGRLQTQHIRYRNAHLKTKRYDVIKLFKYRAAAFADLTTWSYLNDYDITNACMVTALFPCGKYSEIDMSPSRTLGTLFDRLLHDPGYSEELIRKSAEIEYIGL